MSAMSLGRRARAFIMTRSSGVASGTRTPCTRAHWTRCTTSFSKDKPPRTMSTSVPVCLCRTRSARVLRANANASGRRGANPSFFPQERNSAHRASSSHTRVSTSWVSRGRPCSEAATPPTIAPGTFAACNHETRSAIARRKGGRCLALGKDAPSESRPQTIGFSRLSCPHGGTSKHLGRGH